MINSRNEIMELLGEYIVTQQEHVYQLWMPDIVAQLSRQKSEIFIMN